MRSGRRVRDAAMTALAESAWAVTRQVVKPAAGTVATVWKVGIVMARRSAFAGIIEHMFVLAEGGIGGRKPR